jgi:hypothetical protein
MRPAPSTRRAFVNGTAGSVSAIRLQSLTRFSHERRAGSQLGAGITRPSILLSRQETLQPLIDFVLCYLRLALNAFA